MGKRNKEEEVDFIVQQHFIRKVEQINEIKDIGKFILENADKISGLVWCFETEDINGEIDTDFEYVGSINTAVGLTHRLLKELEYEQTDDVEMLAPSDITDDDDEED